MTSVADPRRRPAQSEERVGEILGNSVVHCPALLGKREQRARFQKHSRSIICALAADPRTRKSWVQILPGAPVNQRLAAMQAFSFGLVLCGCYVSHRASSMKGQQCAPVWGSEGNCVGRLGSGWTVNLRDRLALILWP